MSLVVAVYLACAERFVVEGRGTPAPIDPPRHLVVSGLYRWVRNPMYLAVVTVLLGESYRAYAARVSRWVPRRPQLA